MEHKRMFVRGCGAIGAMALGFIGLSAANPADTAEAVSGGDAALEEVVVTAERREANVQTTALALSAVSGDRLADIGATGLSDLQSIAPSFQFSTQSADAVRVQMTIRGIGSDVIEAGADAGVGLYLDGVYMGRTSAALTSIFDISRVEVLRGPQGTLYGRNTSGGAVNLISNGPTRTFEAFGEISGGDYGEYSLKGVLNGALSDTMAARLSFGGEHRNGYQRNLYPGGSEADDSRTTFARLQVSFSPSERFSFLGSAYYDKIGGVGPGTKSFGATPLVFATGILPNGVPNLSGLANASTYSLAQAFPTDYHTVYKNTHESVDVPLAGIAGTATIDFGGAALKSITSYQSTTQDEVRDIDGTELDMLALDRHEKAGQFTQEFVLSSTKASPLEWVLGGFYFREAVANHLSILGPGGFVGFAGPGGGLDQEVVGDVKTESYAAFGQVSYHVTAPLKLTAGVRYTDDSRSMISSAGFVDRANGAVLLAGGLTVRPSIDIKDSWRPFTWKAGADYQFTEDVFGYVSVSNAFKSGGFNLGNPLAGSFEPETMTAYEVGLKTRAFEHRLQVNLAAFHYDIKKMQLQVFGIGGPEIVNATGGSADGVEVETAAAITRNLKATVNAAYLRTQFDNGFFAVDPAQLSLILANPPPLVDLSGNRFPRAPQFSGSASVDYSHPVGSGTLILGADYSYQGEIYFRAFNDHTPYRFQPAYGVFNARLGYEWGNGAWSLVGHLKNIADKAYLTNDFVPPILLGSPDIGTVGAPRTWQIVLRHKFR